MAKKMLYKIELMPPKDVIEGFVCRQNILHEVLGYLHRNLGKPKNTHLIVTGLRGMGKSMLAHRVRAEIITNRHLASQWHPVVLPQESDNISLAADIWVQALRSLGLVPPGFEIGRSKNLSKKRTLLDHHNRAGNALLEFGRSKKKRLLVIVENFDRVVSRQMNITNLRTLMKFLQGTPEIMLFVTSTRPLNALNQKVTASMQDFQEYALPPLFGRDFKHMWDSMATNPLPSKYVRPMEILTGGNPRLIAILSRENWHQINWASIRDRLPTIVDAHSDFFESRFASLPIAERKVYEAVAARWDPTNMEEILGSCGIPVQKCKCALESLVERGLLQTVCCTVENEVYEVTEHFDTIYLLMTRGGSEAANARAAMHFMFTFYDHHENIEHGKRLIEYAAAASLQERELAVSACATLIERLNKYTKEEALRLLTEPARSEIEEARALTTVLQQAPNVFGNLALQGQATQGIIMITESGTASMLMQPIHAGLKLYLGQNVCAAQAVLEVAKDILRLMGKEQVNSDGEV